MTSDDTAGYLNHHLKIAGRADTLFSADAITVIHNAARGYQHHHRADDPGTATTTAPPETIGRSHFIPRPSAPATTASSAGSTTVNIWSRELVEETAGAARARCLRRETRAI
jgi:hypothetical protein